MDNWTIDFISQEDFKEHVAETIRSYKTKLEPYTLQKFNSNIIDPIKMVFDKNVYSQSWEDLIASEIFRQRDKSSANEIGYFHQCIFKYMDNCTVPNVGEMGGWDVIYDHDYQIDEYNRVRKIYVEMKNKHNTMNSASSQRTYMKMQNQLLHDDTCACFLVEAIAKTSQNIVWHGRVDGQSMEHAKIRRVSLDQWYKIVTGEDDAFYQICYVLPQIVQEVLAEDSEITAPYDTVYDELKEMAAGYDEPEEQAMMLAMYMLGFKDYLGF